jgi:hypothetical protein
VPILGREEDAANQVAAFLLLGLGTDETCRAIASIAVMYASEAKEAPSKLKDFADEHSLRAQRLFNLLCLSYDAHPELFGDLVEKGFLPRERAEQCGSEYRQVRFAFNWLVALHLKGLELVGPRTWPTPQGYRRPRSLSAARSVRKKGEESRKGSLGA